MIDGNGESTTQPTGALHGVRVLDLSRVLAGPYCTQQLADHGAHVIKVEPPAGDETRTWGPPFRDGTAAYFFAANRGKQNICLDLASPEGIEVFWRLAEWADVIVENFRLGTMERWGIEYAVLAERFPRLIYCRVSGYGDDGPLGGLPAYDAVLQAVSGLMSVNGYPDRESVRVGVPIVDIATGMQALAGVSIALYERERSGRGQMLEVALFDTALSLMLTHAQNYFLSGTEPRRTGSGHPSIVPYDCYEARGGAVFVGAANDRSFAKLCDVLGAPELVADQRFATNGVRGSNRAALTAILSTLIAEWDRDELASRLEMCQVPAGPVSDLSSTLASAHAAHRDMVVAIDDYQGIGPVVKLLRTPPSAHTAPRDKGADTEHVLRLLDFDDNDVARLLGASRATPSQ